MYCIYYVKRDLLKRGPYCMKGGLTPVVLPKLSKYAYIFCLLDHIGRFSIIEGRETCKLFQKPINNKLFVYKNLQKKNHYIFFFFLHHSFLQAKMTKIDSLEAMLQSTYNEYMQDLEAAFND